VNNEIWADGPNAGIGCQAGCSVLGHPSSKSIEERVTDQRVYAMVVEDVLLSYPCLEFDDKLAWNNF
jgi:hypothetical protein